jgi:hypothetical protein
MKQSLDTEHYKTRLQTKKAISIANGVIPRSGEKSDKGRSFSVFANFNYKIQTNLPTIEENSKTSN